MTLRAGAATSNITPRLGVSINGSMQNKFAEHIHDELHARCLVLDDGQEQIALVVCDSCMIPRPIHDLAKEEVQAHTGLPIDRILISATHTHSAACVGPVFQSEPDLEYAAFLAQRIADGIRRAQNNLVPARIAWGAGQDDQQVFNRRWRMKPGTDLTNPFGEQDQVRMNPPSASDTLIEPAGPIDPEICILAVEAADGRPLAVLANYSLHYVGGTGPGHISADYFGMFAARLGVLLGTTEADPSFVGIMSNGTSGNINNVNFRQARPRQEPYVQMRHVAYEVAQEVHRVYQQLKFRDSAKLAMLETPLVLLRRIPAPADVARAEYILSQAPTDGQLTVREQIYARETVLLAQWEPKHETILQAIRIDELGIVSSPCETFVETGLAIKEQSPLETTFAISLANDYAGYLPTLEHHRLGGYETWRARSSFLEVEAEKKIRQRLLDMLKQLA